MSYATTLRTVKRALDLLEQVETGGGADAAGGAAVEVAEKTLSLFGMLRDAYLLMGEINEIWSANDITEQITAAAKAGGSLAGHSPLTWARWGALLPATQVFLNSDYTTTTPDGGAINETPRQTLMRRYQQEASV